MKFRPDNAPKNNIPFEAVGGREISAPESFLEKFEMASLRIKQETRQLLEQDKELKEKFNTFLEQLNLPLLQSIFTDYLRRSGISKDRWNFLNREDICIESSMGPSSYEEEIAYGSYIPAYNVILLDCDYIKKSNSLEILRGFIHEYTHSLSCNKFKINEDQDIKYRSGIHASGYHTVSTKKRTKYNKTSGEAFNEGVTERIAHEILITYLKSNGDFSRNKTDIEQILNKYTFKFPKDWVQYGLYMFFVQSICEQVAEWSELSTDTIWQSFVRGYFTADSLYEEETKQLFSESMAPDFLQKLQKLSNKTNLNSFRNFSEIFNFPNTDTFRKKWLQHLGLEVKE